MQAPKNLDAIFYPQSVAVVGTNKTKGTVPHDIFYNILDSNFQGIVYPVSPGEKSVAGVKAYKYIVDIEDPVDLAVLVFPSSVCHLALEQCGKKGVKSAIIISAGFKEIGGKGVEREKQIKSIADQYGISFIGPNCLGVINTDPKMRLNASFARKMPEEGNIGFLSQSGALCTAVLDYAQAKHIGFSKFISFGNKADINEIDLLYYLKDDPRTKVILVYLEEISDGFALMKAAQVVISESGKPVLILKSGRTEEGAAAAASHTGSLAGSDVICDAALRQAGIIRCSDIEEMFNRAIALAYQPLPQSNRVAIVTNAGGPGVLATDAAINQGLKLARFSEATSDILRKSLPKTANTKNPIDVIGDAHSDRYNVALSSTLKDENVDGVFVILTPQSMTDIDEIAREICNCSIQFKKPIYTSFMGEADVASGIDILQRNRIPHYILPESMCCSFSAALNFKNRSTKSDSSEYSPLDHINPQKAKEIFEKALQSGKRFLSGRDAYDILQAYGFPVGRYGQASSKEDAVALADQIGYPVVMKIVSEEIVHKYDVNGVLLNLCSAQEVAEGYSSMMKVISERKPHAKIEGVLIQEMSESGVEVILGVKRDPSFNAVLLFGLGGIFVEIFEDVSFRIAPLSPPDIQTMITDIKGYPLLSGARGRKIMDIASIEDCLRRLSQLAVDCPQIKELDINPLIVRNEGLGALAADIKIVI
ncbi:MAG: acetate--CoA ligase family protein [Candidatus Omnitrophica bacterium]|nr:acetate--CoA ligase family protein [Candidatus Omnitrophota bacterium]